jgi:hypothetical protein
MQPLCFAILKRLTPPDVETVLYDERLEDIPTDEPTDLVAMTVETYTARRAYQLAGAYRRRGVRVVMGGYHPTFLPRECLAYADAVVQGDAEGVWEEVVEDARHGCLRPVYRREHFEPLGGVIPDRSIFSGKRYVPVTLVQYGRGCRFNCDFCSIRAFYGSSVRQRPVREVCDEIERSGARRVFFVDDNIFVDIEKANELFEARAPLYDHLKRDGRLIHDPWWLDPRFRYGHATFHPRGMTADELTEGVYRSRTAFNTARSILYRMSDLRTLRSPRRAVRAVQPDLSVGDPPQAGVAPGWTGAVADAGARHARAGRRRRRFQPRRARRPRGTERMKITFVKPNIGRHDHSLYVDEGRMEPLQLGVIAGLTPPDVECVLYDDRIESIDYDERTDLVAITV